MQAFVFSRLSFSFTHAAVNKKVKISQEILRNDCRRKNLMKKGLLLRKKKQFQVKKKKKRKHWDRNNSMTLDVEVSVVATPFR